MISLCITVNAMGQKTSLLPDLQRTVSAFLSLCFSMKKTTQLILVDFTLTAKCCLGRAFLFVPAFFVFLLSIMIFSISKN